MHKKSKFSKVLLKVVHLVLIFSIVAFCIYIMRYNNIFQEDLKSGKFSQIIASQADNNTEANYALQGLYTSDAVFEMASSQGLSFAIILIVLICAEGIIKVFYIDQTENAENHFLSHFLFHTASIFGLIGAVLIVYSIMPFFHNFDSRTVKVDREVKLPDQIITDKEIVYEEVEIVPSFPFDISGSEAVVIDASSGMQTFMAKFYEENIPFFAQEDRQIFIMKEGKLQLFDGDFSSISYSGSSSNIAELLCNLKFDTIWLFSDEVYTISPQDIATPVQKKSIIVYSPRDIDVNDLETYFSVVNGITVNDIK